MNFASSDIFSGDHGGSQVSPSSTMSIPSSGSSTARRASTTCSFVGIGSRLAEEPHFFAALTREEVDAVHEANPVAAGAHNERVRACGIGEEADAAEQVAVGDAGRGNDYLARREIVDREDLLQVLDPVLARLLDLGSRRRPKMSLQLAAETAERGRRHHGLARAADSD